MVTIKKNTKLKMYETNGFSDGKTAIFFSLLLCLSFRLLYNYFVGYIFFVSNKQPICFFKYFVRKPFRSDSLRFPIRLPIAVCAVRCDSSDAAAASRLHCLKSRSRRFCCFCRLALRSPRKQQQQAKRNETKRKKSNWKTRKKKKQ